MHKFLISILFVATLCVVNSRLRAQVNAFASGPPELRHALTFYVVNDGGGDFTVHLRWRDEHQIYSDRPRLIRIFDPEERLLVKRFEPCTRVQPGQTIPEYQLDVPAPGRGPGVYQVIITGFGGTSEFATTPPMKWGVLGYPRLTGLGNQFADAHIFLPPGLEHLSIRTEGAVQSLRLTDEHGQPRIEGRGPNAFGQTPLPPNDGVDRVWRLSIIGAERGEPYRIDFGGAPIILCPDESTARAICGSVDVLSDGTICFHKFQIHVHELLRHYRQLPPRQFALYPPPLAQHRSAWVAQPERNDLLLGEYGVFATLPLALNEQNLDQASPWFGTIKVWHDGPRLPARPQNPWTRVDRLGLTRAAPFANIMAAVYSVNQPFNPLHRHEGLRNRIIIAMLQDLMLLREHEMFLPVIPDNFWGSDRAFSFASVLQSLPIIIDDCPAQVRDVLIEGFQRYVDHESIAQVASTTNQWTFIVKGLLDFSNATRAPEDREVVERHLRWILTRNPWDLGHMPAGYFFEMGPDATYNGIAAHNLAWVYKQMLRDGKSQVVNDLGEALRSCFVLFNHTIAPQPDGSIVGASNFATRTAGDWAHAQHGAGAAMLADQFPEAAPLVTNRIWPTIRSLDGSITTRRGNEEAMVQRLQYYTDEQEIWRNADAIKGGPELHFMIWQHFANVPLRSRLPMVAHDRFTQVFGDEFMCVRRPRYYSFLHAGKPMPEWAKDRRPVDPRQQFPHNGGGLSMFWSPAFGVSLLAQNWSAYAANTIVVERDVAGGKRVDWEDYWSVMSVFDANGATGHITGNLRDQPLTFERRLRFLEIGVECNLTLTASSAAEYSAAWECFPYPADIHPRLHVTAVDEDARPVNKRPASAIVFRNASNEAHIVVFDQPRTCEIGSERVVDHHGKNREFNRVLAALPTDWAAGEQRTFRWCIMAVPTAEVPRAIRAAVAAMKR